VSDFVGYSWIIKTELLEENIHINIHINKLCLFLLIFNNYALVELLEASSVILRLQLEWSVHYGASSDPYLYFSGYN